MFKVVSCSNLEEAADHKKTPATVDHYDNGNINIKRNNSTKSYFALTIMIQPL